MESLPGTIEDTAEEVTRAGGRGVALRCDHTDDEEVRRLFSHVVETYGRIDVLVNNAWGAHETFSADALSARFWEQRLEHGDSMMNRGVRNHVIAARHAAPIFVRQKRGLVIATSFWDGGKYLRGNLFYDLAKCATNRLAFAIAEELRPHGVASVALSPGWMRTEIVLAAHGTDEARWREREELAATESPRYLGRAVVALARDPNVMEKSVSVLYVAELAREYGFTDIDGRQPPRFVLPT